MYLFRCLFLLKSHLAIEVLLFFFFNFPCIDYSEMAMLNSFLALQRMMEVLLILFAENSYWLTFTEETELSSDSLVKNLFHFVQKNLKKFRMDNDQPVK